MATEGNSSRHRSHQSPSPRSHQSPSPRSPRSPRSPEAEEVKPGHQDQHGQEEERRHAQQQQQSNPQQETQHPTTTKSPDHTVQSPDHTVVPDSDLKCGWKTFNPRFLQGFMTPQWVLTSFCVASFIQGMVISGFVNVALPVLERRFQLRSVEVGLIVSMYNVGSLLLMSPVTYFGGSGHKPKIMAIGTACMGIGSLIFAIPHFIAPQYKFSKEIKDTCPYERGEDVPLDSSVRNYRFLLMFANMVHGCSTVPFYTLAIAFMDDNLPTRKSSRYIGTYYTLAIIGPAVGFILGGYLLNIYTDITVDPRSLGLTPSSSVWIGAWWLGFVIAGVMAFCASIPIAAFPKTLPGTSHLASQKRIEVDTRLLAQELINKETMSKAHDIPKSVKRLLQNYTFVFISLAATVETMIGSGLSNFGTKLFESQFGMSASSAGGLIGTWLVFLGFLGYCPNLDYAGTLDDKGMKVPISLNCSANCSCPFEFNPVCGKDKKMYFSPCIAGCRRGIIMNNVNVYTDCDCINLGTHTDNATFIVEAERVKCSTECFIFVLYIGAVFTALFCTFYISAPGISATMRCVTAQQKSFALGLQWTCIRLLGTIPAPVIFGKAMDLACTMWSGQETKVTGNCLLYDNRSMSINLSILLLSLKATSVMLFVCANLSYKPPDPTPPFSSVRHVKNAEPGQGNVVIVHGAAPPSP
ncbi:solute carrier organic anion transporter family member 4A1-like isoform X2 [Ornithodoros turicata]|uniref:solute carrier organic anion transporter family member 4A1-like isoform X2 n=1 Tax=Ornithodoros turicata TaxID=34597 RepID=UPI003138D4EE